MASLRKRGHESGQDLVEFALVTPLLMLILLGILEFSLVVFSYNSISNAAREAARYGIIHHKPSDDAGIKQAALTSMTGLPADPSMVSWVYVDSAGVIKVQVGFDYTFITAPMQRVVGGSGTIHLAARATMNTEDTNP